MTAVKQFDAPFYITLLFKLLLAFRKKDLCLLSMCNRTKTALRWEEGIKLTPPFLCAYNKSHHIYTAYVLSRYETKRKKRERSSNRNAFITFPYVTKPGSHLGDNASGMETVKNTGFGQHSRKEREGKSDRQRELSPSLTRFDNKDDLSERIPEVTNLEHSLRQEVLSTTRFT